MADLGKAYVQIVPSAKGISGSISNLLKGESTSAGTASGENLAASLLSKFKSLAVGTAVGKAVLEGIKATLSEGAALEQSLGGIETMFKGNADIVKEYAKSAYQSAGVSANDYMEQVTSFSAALINSLGGDTKTAASYANTAMVDMADNANKFGTDIESIQNAYQGFAKQNYTMLDNLKLGYGGTKSEMERLLQDAEKLTGKKFDISSFSDITQAIHAIQQEMGVTGTTAEEAASTFSGSFGSMKAAAQDFLGALATTGSDSTLFDLTDSLGSLVSSFSTFFFGNLIPMLGRIVVNLPTALASYIGQNAGAWKDKAVEMMNNLGDGLEEGIPDAIAKFAEFVVQLLQNVSEMAPKIIEGGGELIQAGIQLIVKLGTGLIQSIPTLIGYIPQIATSLVDAFSSYEGSWLSTGASIISSILSGIMSLAGTLLTTIGSLLLSLLTAIGEWGLNMVSKAIEVGTNFVTNIVTYISQLPGQIATFISNILSDISSFASNMASEAVQAGSQFLNNVANYVSQLPARVSQSISSILSNVSSFASNMASKAVEAASNFASNIKNGLASLPDEMASIGTNIVQGIVNGITNAAGNLYNSLKNLASNALESAKSALGIKSPSRVFRDEVGKWIPEGIAVGISMDRTLPSAMRKLANNTLMEAQADYNNLGYIARYGSLSKASASTIGTGGVVNNFNQTINSAKVMSPSEIAQEAKNMQRRLAWV